MRRARAIAIVAAAALLVGACSGDDTPTTDGEGATSTSAVPDSVADFVAAVAPAGTVAFRATYRVLTKLGGATTEVQVEATPPAWRLTAGDVVVVGGPVDATCSVAGARCRAGIEEAALSGAGVFSGFFTDSTARQLAVAAGRAGASPPTASTRDAAGTTLDCRSVASSGLVACLTPEGVVGLVDDPARRVELVRYEPTAPGEPISPPFAVG